MPVFYLLKPTQQDLRVEHLLISGGAKVIRMLLAVTSLQSATRKDRECLLCYRQQFSMASPVATLGSGFHFYGGCSVQVSSSYLNCNSYLCTIVLVHDP